jgi:hypothetical protein
MLSPQNSLVSCTGEGVSFVLSTSRIVRCTVERYKQRLVNRDGIKPQHGHVLSDLKTATRALGRCIL